MIQNGDMTWSFPSTFVGYSDPSFSSNVLFFGSAGCAEQTMVGSGDPKQYFTKYMQYYIFNSCPRIVLRMGVLIGEKNM